MQYKNIYIRSLEIGFEKENDGISFNQLKTILSNEEYEYDNNILREWYFSNFENENRRKFVIEPLSSYLERESDDQINPLSSDSFMQYVEYLELKEAREATRKAFRQSKIAMYIAVASIILNVFLSESIFDRIYNRQKNTKTDQVMESPVKTKSEYQNGHPAELNNLQMKKEVQDTIIHVEQLKTRAN